MALVKADRVKELSSTTGTGSLTLSGAPSGYRTFASVMSSADTCYYAISHQSQAEWETGLATFTSPSTLARTTIHSSSNGGSAVNFSAGTKEVVITITASELGQVIEAAPGIVPKLAFGLKGEVLANDPISGSINSVAIGYNAGNTAISSGHNVFIGRTAGANNIASTFCVVIGSAAQAGSAATYSSNVVIGASAGNFKTAGNSQVLIGRNAGSNSNGDQNVGIGASSLFSAFNVTTSTAIGTTSLRNCANGSGNVAVGYNAGSRQADGSALPSATNSIYIGSESKGFDSFDYNSIVIGANAVGEGANTTVIGTSSTTQTKLFGRLIPTGEVEPASLADASAANNSIYFSTTANKLVFKDSSGVVNNLY